MCASLSTIYVPQIYRKLCAREVAQPISIDESLALEIRQVAQIFRSSLSPNNHTSFNGRLERGLFLALNGSVMLDSSPQHPNRCRVISSDRSRTYLVDIDSKYCDCPDSQKGYHCKHRIAAYFVLQAITNRNKNQIKIPVLIPRSKESEISSVTQSTANANISPPHKTADQFLRELGYDNSPTKLAETTTVQPAIRLGNLYRRYLHGEDLSQNSCTVTIVNLTMENVTPHPSRSSYKKWCLWVDGMPQGMPNGILFGPDGDRELVNIFGKVDIQTLKGKSLVIYPQPVSVAGQTKIAIRFRRTQ